MRTVLPTPVSVPVMKIIRGCGSGFTNGNMSNSHRESASETPLPAAIAYVTIQGLTVATLKKSLVFCVTTESP